MERIHREIRDASYLVDFFFFFVYNPIYACLYIHSKIKRTSVLDNEKYYVCGQTFARHAKVIGLRWNAISLRKHSLQS